MSNAIRIVFSVLAFLSPALTRAAVPADPREPGECIIVTGGVSLSIWEKWKAQPHDNWWANFVRASRIRIEQIKQANPERALTNDPDCLSSEPAVVARSSVDPVASKGRTPRLSSRA